MHRNIFSRKGSAGQANTVGQRYTHIPGRSRARGRILDLIYCSLGRLEPDFPGSLALLTNAYLRVQAKNVSRGEGMPWLSQVSDKKLRHDFEMAAIGTVSTQKVQPKLVTSFTAC